MNILVTGAAGYIGNRTAKALVEKDWVSSVIGTDINPARFSHAKYRYYQQDIRDSFDEVFEKESVDTIIHAAWVLTPIHNKGLMEDINKSGTKNILHAAVNANVKQIVHLSSTTCYGFHPDNDQPLTEDSSPLRGNSDFTYSKNKREVEKIMAEFAAGQPDILTTVLRPCFVVGPGFTNPMAEHFKKKLVLLPAVRQPWQYVHEDDLIGIILSTIEQRVAGVYNVTADGSMTFKEMIGSLGNFILPVPWLLIFPLNNLAWHTRMSFITKFPSSAMRMMIHPWIASNEKIKQATGYQFKYDTKGAFADFVRSVKAE